MTGEFFDTTKGMSGYWGRLKLDHNSFDLKFCMQNMVQFKKHQTLKLLQRWSLNLYFLENYNQKTEDASNTESISTGPLYHHVPASKGMDVFLDKLIKLAVQSSQS